MRPQKYPGTPLPPLRLGTAACGALSALGSLSCAVTHGSQPQGTWHCGQAWAAEMPPIDLPGCCTALISKSGHHTWFPGCWVSRSHGIKTALGH